MAVLLDVLAVLWRALALAARRPGAVLAVVIASIACGIFTCACGAGAFPLGIVGAWAYRTFFSAPKNDRAGTILGPFLVAPQVVLLVLMGARTPPATWACQALLVSAVVGALTFPVHLGALLGVVENRRLDGGIGEAIVRSARPSSVIVIGALAGLLGVALPALLFRALVDRSAIAAYLVAGATSGAVHLLLPAAAYDVLVRAPAIAARSRASRVAWTVGPAMLVLVALIAHASSTPALAWTKPPRSSDSVSIEAPAHFGRFTVIPGEEEGLVVVASSGERTVLAAERVGPFGLPSYAYACAWPGAVFRGHAAVAVGEWIDGPDGPARTTWFDLDGHRLDDTWSDRLVSRLWAPVLGGTLLAALAIAWLLVALARTQRTASALAPGRTVIEGRLRIVRGSVVATDAGLVVRGDVRILADDGMLVVDEGEHRVEGAAAAADGAPAFAIASAPLGAPTLRTFPRSAASFFATGTLEAHRAAFARGDGLRLGRWGVAFAVGVALASVGVAAR